MRESYLSMTLDEIESAAEILHRVVPPTPQYAWPKLRRRTGGTVWVKHENHSPTGAFKVRGGLVYMDRLLRSGLPMTGVAAATRGNHGQSIAFAAARAGIPATIFVPRGNSPDQNSAMQTWGARVVESGQDFDEARHEGERVAAEQGLHWVPSFHRDLVVGVASYALELFQCGEPFDVVYVAVGMGSGICGLIAVRDLLGLKTEIVAVGAVNAPASARSIAARRPVKTSSALTFADGIATREPHPEAINVICRGAARMVEVTEDEIAEAMRVYFDDTHQVAEGAGAAALAALLSEGESAARRKAAVILSGGNIERARFLEVLAGHTPSAP